MYVDVYKPILNDSMLGRYVDKLGLLQGSSMDAVSACLRASTDTPLRYRAKSAHLVVQSVLCIQVMDVAGNLCARRESRYAMFTCPVRCL